MIDKQEIPKYFERAAEWLEKHRNQHIVSALGRDENGLRVKDPENAVCFCAVGRLQAEAGFCLNREGEQQVNDMILSVLPDELKELGTWPIEYIEKINDRDEAEYVEMGNVHIQLAGKAGINILRDYAKRMKEALA